MQKFQEETNIANEKVVVIKNVNSELQSTVEKLQKEIQEKQKSLKSLTQGKKNLNAILGTKIYFNKEGLVFVPKNKKKYDVKTATFIFEKNGSKKNPLIKLNGFFEDKLTQNPTHISSFKGKEKVGEFKSGQTKSNKN